MANAYVINQRPITYGGALSLLAEMLVSAGWTIRSSGDGLSGFSSNGKVFTGTGSGALGWNNNKAWACLQDPGAGRQLVLQHDAAAGARFKYSSSAKFIGGSPSATVTPSAADEVPLWGAGSDASPTPSPWFSTQTIVANIGGGGGNVTYLGAAMDTAPYGFWFYSTITGSANNSTSNNDGLATIMMDPVTSVAEDPDPVVFHVSDDKGFRSAFNLDGGPNGGITAWNTASGGGNDGTFAYMDAAKTRFLSVLPAMLVSNVSGNAGQIDGSLQLGIPFPNSSSAWLAPNPFSGKQELIPFFYMRMQNGFTELPGIKGWSTLCRWPCLPWTLKETTADKQWIHLGGLYLKWDGVTTPFQ